MPESNKKRRTWHGQRGAWHWPDVRGLAKLYRVSVWRYTEYCYRGPCPYRLVEGCCGFLYKLYSPCSALLSPLFSFYFDTFLSRLLFFIFCSFFLFLLRFFLLSSICICRFLSSLLLHRSNNTILFGPSILDVLLFSLPFIFEL